MYYESFNGFNAIKYMSYIVTCNRNSEYEATNACSDINIYLTNISNIGITFKKSDIEFMMFKIS